MLYVRYGVKYYSILRKPWDKIIGNKVICNWESVINNKKKESAYGRKKFGLICLI